MKAIKPFNFIHNGVCEFKVSLKNVNPVLLQLLQIQLLVGEHLPSDSCFCKQAIRTLF